MLAIYKKALFPLKELIFPFEKRVLLPFKTGTDVADDADTPRLAGFVQVCKQIE